MKLLALKHYLLTKFKYVYLLRTFLRNSIVCLCLQTARFWNVIFEIQVRNNCKIGQPRSGVYSDETVGPSFTLFGGKCVQRSYA